MYEHLLQSTINNSSSSSSSSITRRSFSLLSSVLYQAFLFAPNLYNNLIKAKLEELYTRHYFFMRFNHVFDVKKNAV